MNEEEAKTKERMEMEFNNPENFQNVDPQLAEDEEEEAMIEGSSVPMMRNKKSSQMVFEEEEDVDKLKIGHGWDEEKYGGEPPEGDGLYRGDGGEIGTRRCEIQHQINRGKEECRIRGDECDECA